jgi:hypothetical protein
LINGGDSYYGFNEERERTVGFFGKVGRMIVVIQDL